MSLKHRNSIALLLILLASLCWIWGQELMNENTHGNITSTTHPLVYETMVSSTAEFYEEHSSLAGSVQNGLEFSQVSGNDPSDSPSEVPNKNTIGFILSVSAAVSAAIAIFIFWQQTPVLGPDGFCMLIGLGGVFHNAMWNSQMISSLFDAFLSTLQSLPITNFLVSCIILSALRTLWGWARSRFSPSWFLLHRMTERIPYPQISLLLLAGWILMAFSFMGYQLLWFTYYHRIYPLPFGSMAAAVCCGIFCLWQYGSDLHHVQKQLTNYQQGNTITVGNGAFSQTEAQLLAVQAQHEEAIRTAITSERFKVELIANVSHDLRTPLTSILGYSELLQQETLSPEGTKQLRQLRQKAGYMSDLVDSLFELTKISSGVVEAKKEQIDLIRLLEQTIGLLDDRLTEANLVVRRHYCADSILILTDGARMHQVFANLLGNAIKYALPGTRIYIEVKEQEQHYQIRLINTASYEMDFHPKEILQRFARGDKARSTQGSGLGLAIAQTYTDSVDGNFYITIDGDQFSAIVELPKTERDL